MEVLTPTLFCSLIIFLKLIISKWSPSKCICPLSSKRIEAFFFYAYADDIVCFFSEFVHKSQLMLNTLYDKASKWALVLVSITDESKPHYLTIPIYRIFCASQKHISLGRLCSFGWFLGCICTLSVLLMDPYKNRPVKNWEEMSDVIKFKI